MTYNKQRALELLADDLTTPQMWARSRQAALDLLKTVVGLSGAGVAFFATLAKDHDGISGLKPWVFYTGLGSMAGAVALGLLGWGFQILMWNAFANALDPRKTDQHPRFERKKNIYRYCRAILMVVSAVLFIGGVIAAGTCIVERS